MENDRTTSYSKTLLLTAAILVFIAANVFMACQTLHVIRDIDSAECCHASFAYLINQNAPLDIIISEILRNFNGGGYLSGIMPFSAFYAVIAYIFGNSYLTLKLIPLLFHTLTFLLLGILLKKNFNIKVLFFFCIFYMFAPLYMYKWNLTFWASHPESSFFSALILYLYIAKQRPFLLGLIAGLSFYLSYFCLPMLTAVLLCEKFTEKKAFRSFFINFIPAFIVGFSPWLMFRYCNTPHMVSEEKNLMMFVPDITNIIPKTITAVFNAPFFGPVFNTNNFTACESIKYIQHIFFLTLIIISLTPVIKHFNFQEKQKKIIQIISAAIIFYLSAVIISAHNKEVFDIASHAPRYFVALFPLFFFIGAVFTAHLASINKPIFTVCIAIIAIYAGTNIYDYKTFIRLGQKDAYKKYKGILYYFSSINCVALSEAEDINKAIEALKDTPIYLGFAKVFYKNSEARYKTLPHYSENFKSNSEIIKNLKEEPRKFRTLKQRNDFLEGFGYGLAIKHRWNKQVSENFINNYAEQEYVTYLLKGLNKAFSNNMIRSKNQSSSKTS